MLTFEELGLTPLDLDAQELRPDESSNFPYQPLEPGHIRLLRITSRADVRCEIRHFDQETEVAYDALSYCWGDPPSSHTIILNETPVLVRANLWRFLQQEHVLDGQWYWIDALCINQCDFKEREEQIKNMRMIFPRAQRVVAWLGPTYYDSDKAIRRLQLPLRTMWNEPIANAIAKLCQRPYWSRLWIFQELVLARKFIILCGACILDRDTLTMLWSSISTAKSRVQENLDYKQVVSSPASMMFKLIEAYNRSDLWTLIMQTRGLHCADRRDKVYGLLAVSNTTDIVADYHKPMHVLLNEVLRAKHNETPPTITSEIVQQCRDLYGSVFDTDGAEGLSFMLRGLPQTPLTRAFPLASRETGISLWWACQYNNSSIAKVLLTAGSVNHYSLRGLRGWVPRFNQDKAFQLLIGADFFRCLPNSWFLEMLQPRYEGEVLNRDSLLIWDVLNIAAVNPWFKQPCLLAHFWLVALNYTADSPLWAALELLRRTKALCVADSRTVVSQLCHLGRQKQGVRVIRNIIEIERALNCESLGNSLWPDMDLGHIQAAVLRAAILGWKSDTARYLLAQPELNINAKDEAGHTALHVAFLQGYDVSGLNAVRDLFSDARLDISAVDNGRAVLELSLRNSSPSSGHARPAGWTPCCVDGAGRTVLHLIAEATHAVGFGTFVAEVLRICPGIVNLQDQQGRTALHTAIIHLNIDVIQALLACDSIDTSLRDTSGDGPLRALVMRLTARRYTCKKRLQFRSADERLKIISAERGLVWTDDLSTDTEARIWDIFVKLSEQNTIEVNERRSGSQPLIHLSAKTHGTRMFEHILAVTKDVNVDYLGCNTLHMLLEQSQPGALAKIKLVLRDNKIDPNALNLEKRTPLLEVISATWMTEAKCAISAGLYCGMRNMMSPRFDEMAEVLLRRVHWAQNSFVDSAATGRRRTLMMCELVKPLFEALLDADVKLFARSERGEHVLDIIRQNRWHWAAKMMLVCARRKCLRHAYRPCHRWLWGYSPPRLLNNIALKATCAKRGVRAWYLLGSGSQEQHPDELSHVRRRTSRRWPRHVRQRFVPVWKPSVARRLGVSCYLRQWGEKDDPDHENCCKWDFA